MTTNKTEKEKEKQAAIIKVVDLMVRFRISPQDILDELKFAMELGKKLGKVKDE
jgi:hypothetical protein